MAPEATPIAVVVPENGLDAKCGEPGTWRKGDGTATA
jgi:hypothetical protein